MKTARPTLKGTSRKQWRQPIPPVMADSKKVPVVLVADDDGVTRAMVRAWLSDSGFEVVTACDGDEALELAADQQPDLLLVDVTMPGADGYDVCRTIQATSATPPPVIFLTAHTTMTARVTGLDAGAVDYIVKPFAQAELVARVRAALRSKEARDGFAERATRDGLTGLINRAEIDQRAEEAVRLAERYERPLSCLMVDIDHFKQINDRFGHAAGDAVLREAARRIVTACRASDVVARYGGEEFLLLLPETRGLDAVTTADKLRRVLSEHPVELDGLDIPITASVGVAEWNAGMERSALYEAADQALYRAKENGRNRTDLHQRDR
jgi:two-component system, cell cycle response regulator